MRIVPTVRDPENRRMTPAVDRRRILGLLARSPSSLLAERMARLGAAPDFVWLRRPETGTVMLRGRIGGDGELFHVGEATLTRCTLRLADGTVGVGTVRGCDAHHAERVALCDALLQQATAAERVATEVIDALAEAESARRARAAADTAASRVDFFTLVRGED